MTIDVETFCFATNKYDDAIAKDILNVGLPRLLESLKRYDVKATFFFTGNIVEIEPKVIEIVKKENHEIGCHGYSHELPRAFDVMSYDDQVRDLSIAKNLIENIAGKIRSFRAPAARINEATIKALEKTGFQIDSSIAPQRFDGPMSFGFLKKLAWLKAPRKPYYVSYESVVKAGNSNIFEIPISAAIFPYIGTTMRVCPFLNKKVQEILFRESKRSDSPIVFIYHPNECLDKKGRTTTTRRAENPFGYYFGDRLRHKLKLRNLGMPSIELLEEIFRDALMSGFEFITFQEYIARFSEFEKLGD